MNKNFSQESNNQGLNLKQDENEFGVVDILRFLLGYKRFIFLFTFFITLTAMVYSLLLPLVYSSQVTMMETSEDLSSASRLSGLSNSLSGLTPGLSFSRPEGSKTLNALAILQSRTFIEEFIEENDLLPILFNKEWDKDQNSWKSETFDLYDGYKVFNGIFSISKDNKTEVYALTTEWKEPKQAAYWANSLVEKINMTMRLKSIKEAERNILFLQEELNKNTLVKPENMLYNLIEEQTKSKMLANVQDQHMFVVIDKAIPAKQRSKPERKKITIFGFMIGFLFSIVSVYLTNYFKVIRKELLD